MTRATARIGAILALLAAGAAAWWWMRPERQIDTILHDVASAFTHERPDSGIETLAAVAAIEKHLAADVSIQARDSRIDGRAEVITAAARVRTARPAMRVQFYDRRIAFASDTEASVTVTAEVTTGTASGEDVVDVHQVRATVRKIDGRWVVSTARASAGES
jgi:hypothetical protein